MNPAIRCEKRDENGHRCHHKAGHEKLPIPKRHSAYGHEWGTVRKTKKAKVES